MAEGKKTLTWRPAASADVAAILDYYIESAGVHTAVKLLRKIEDTSHVLEEYPFAGKLRSEVYLGLRSFPVGMHVIFYHVTNTSVEVVRVLDGRQDIDSFDTL